MSDDPARQAGTMRRPVPNPVLLGGGTGALGLALLLDRFQIPSKILIGREDPAIGAACFTPLQLKGTVPASVRADLPEPATISRIHITRGGRTGMAELPGALHSWSRDAFARALVAAVPDRVRTKSVEEDSIGELHAIGRSERGLVVLCRPEWLPAVGRRAPGRRTLAQITLQGGSPRGTRFWHLLPGGSIDALEVEDSRVLVTFRGPIAARPSAALSALEGARENNPMLAERLEGTEVCSPLRACECPEWKPRFPHIGPAVFLHGEGAGLLGSLPWIGDAAWMRNAEIAAPLIFECVRGRSSRRAASARYAAAWRQEFAAFLAENRRLNAVLLGRPFWSLPSPSAIARYAVASLRSSAG